MDTVNYQQGYDEGRHIGKMREIAARSQPRRGIDDSGLISEIRAERQVKQHQGEILDLKQRLVAARAVRDTLREALRTVAPDHPLLNPGVNNPALCAVATEAAENVKRWDDQV